MHCSASSFGPHGYSTKSVDNSKLTIAFYHGVTFETISRRVLRFSNLGSIFGQQRNEDIRLGAPKKSHKCECMEFGWKFRNLKMHEAERFHFQLLVEEAVAATGFECGFRTASLRQLVFKRPGRHAARARTSRRYGVSTLRFGQPVLVFRRVRFCSFGE